MNTTTIDHALRRLGQLVDYHAEVDQFLVGGAAGMLTGVLPPARTTTDCDVVVYLPPAALGAVELAAGASRRSWACRNDGSTATSRSAATRSRWGGSRARSLLARTGGSASSPPAASI